MENQGLEVPSPSDPKEKALSNPNPNKSVNKCLFAVSPLISGELHETWKSMCGLKGKEEWDPTSAEPPSQPFKTNIPRPKVSDKWYRLPEDEKQVPPSGYKLDASFKDVKKQTVNIPTANSQCRRK